jgi:hypothetical protein
MYFSLYLLMILSFLDSGNIKRQRLSHDYRQRLHWNRTAHHQWAAQLSGLSNAYMTWTAKQSELCASCSPSFMYTKGLTVIDTGHHDGSGSPTGTSRGNLCEDVPLQEYHEFDVKAIDIKSKISLVLVLCLGY